MAGKMSAKSETTRSSPGSRRRARILTALHDCVISQGYAKTTLRDVAQAAGMTASHLLYYFPGKDAILLHYFKNVARLLLNRLEEFSHQPPEKQVDLLSDLFFAGKGITRSEIGFMLECFGVAVHHQTLSEEKANLDRQCKAYIRDLFEALAKKPPRDAEERAEIAYAVLIGLRTAAYFETELDLPKARRLFHDSVLRLSRLSRLGPRS
jgi:AcrR family transcriptional regulator